MCSSLPTFHTFYNSLCIAFRRSLDVVFQARSLCAPAATATAASLVKRERTTGHNTVGEGSSHGCRCLSAWVLMNLFRKFCTISAVCFREDRQRSWSRIRNRFWNPLVFQGRTCVLEPILLKLLKTFAALLTPAAPRPLPRARSPITCTFSPPLVPSRLVRAPCGYGHPHC
ncbi:unnamed protein product [Scytosiphon promiscuus]